MLAKLRARICRAGLSAGWVAMLIGLSAFPALAADRVVGGQEAAAGVWPFQAAIMFKSGGKLGMCGGTLIAPRFVLTAGHCVVSFDYNTVTAPENFRVRINSINLVSGGEEHRVKRVILHEEFSKSFPLENDIALLELDSDAQATPVRTEGQGTGRASIATQNSPWAKVIGWGRTKSDSPDPSRVLMEASVEVIDAAHCATRMQSILDKLGPIDQRRICAGTSQGGIDSCHGDSGGPLLLPAQGGGWVQVGVVSYGVEDCGAKGTYSVYARTGVYSDWVEHHVGGKATPAPPATAGAAAPPVAVGAVAGAPAIDASASAGGDLVQVAINPGARLRVGQTFKIQVLSKFDGYLLLIDLDENNKAKQLFPNGRSDQVNKDGAIKANSVLSFPDETYGFQLYAEPPVGRGRLIAIVTKSKVGLEELMKSEEGLEQYPDAPARFVALDTALRAKTGGTPDAPEWSAGYRDYVVVP